MARPGASGEDLACRHLEAQGYRVLARNYRCRTGEIDLVALDGGTLVFVEVRSRSGTRAGTPLESVDGRKQARVSRVARQFCAVRGWLDRDARFDVVGIRFDADPPVVDHVRGAFELRGAP